MTIDDLLMAAKTAVFKMEVNLDGPYAKIFEKKKSQLAVELKTQILLDREYTKASIRDVLEDTSGQRFVFCAQHQEVGFGFALVTDEDPRAKGGNEIVPMGRTRFNEARPWRASDLPQALLALQSAFRDKRNADAAAVLNGADRYNPSVGGDGVPLVSSNHPHEQGFWSNTFRTQQDLNSKSLQAALDVIGNGFVDDMGISIRARGKHLIVPRNLEEVAHNALDRLESAGEMRRTPIVWDALTHPYHWFVQTTVPGLMWFERMPIEFDVYLEAMSNMVLIKGYERRCFECMDPRSVFGSLPSDR